MITSAIGKLFLEAYNERYGTDYDAKRFFVEVYFPLFFGHDKYLLWPQNSPFVQPLRNVSGQYGYVETISGLNIDAKNTTDLNKHLESIIPPNTTILSNQIKKKKDGVVSSVEIIRTISDADRNQMLSLFIKKAETSNPDASMAIGYPAAGDKETTSGQVSNLFLNTTSQDVFFSWFGASLGVGVGDLTILFTNKQILMDIFEGWQHYRKIIDHTAMQRGNQVNTWNGQWLVHRYRTNFDQQHPLDELNITSADKGGVISVETTTWTQVLIGISRHFKSDVQMMGYVYNFGQTNTTIGFLPFYLEHIRRALDLYQRHFGIEEGRKAEPLWGTERGLKTCCQRGAIGIRAMEPKALKGTWNRDERLRVNFDQEQQRLNFNTYTIWLMAMLNSEDMWKKSEDFARALQTYLSNTERRLNTARTNKVEALLTSRGKRSFIAAANEMMDDPQLAEALREIVHLVHTMPDDNVPYFITLIRFNKLALDH